MVAIGRIFDSVQRETARVSWFPGGGNNTRMGNRELQDVKLYHTGKKQEGEGGYLQLGPCRRRELGFFFAVRGASLPAFLRRDGARTASVESLRKATQEEATTTTPGPYVLFRT